MTVEIHRPKTFLRRVERGLVGIAMAVVAFILERVVMKSVRKEGGTVKGPPGKVVTSKGGEVDIDKG
ncbi:MAG: hypothetical protein QOI81_563 [Actinomycetota bacterium]|jgi:hypothetical protein|nr:hypothetical protein [Actinomycetota bacterium]